MKKETDIKIKKVVENWEEKGATSDFNAEKVWLAIANQPRSRVLIPWYYSVSAVAIFVCFLGAFFYLFEQNNQLKKQYQGSLAQLHELKTAKSKVVVKKEVQTQYKTQIKEVVKVVKESPQLEGQVKKMQQQLADMQKEKNYLQQQLVGVTKQLKIVKDSVKVLKDREVRPFLAENAKEPCQEEMALSDITVNINEKALAALPVSKSVKQKKRNKIQIKLVEEKSEKTKKSATLFSSINFN